MLKRLFAITLLFVLIGCSEEKPKEQVADLQLRQVSFSELKGFEDDNLAQAMGAFLRSCDVISKGNGEFLGNSQIKINRQDYLAACAKAQTLAAADFKSFLVANFIPYQVVYKGTSQGKFTSYYEAEINASHVKDNVYQYPIYGLPYDLIEVNLRDFDVSLPAKKIIGRKEGNRLVPYYTRSEIHRQGINAPVILWSDSAVDIFVMQIQGSAVAKLPDGARLRVAFAGSNGRQFKGIGSILLAKGLISSGQASMINIKKWLKSNPEEALANMNENDRYIFHKLGSPEGPIGAMGVPLTAGRSLAVDPSFVPLGAVLWLETTQPGGQPLNRLVVAQDIGSAIKGAIRGDYFWGSGGDDILALAGSMNSQGSYFVLLPKHIGD